MLFILLTVALVFVGIAIMFALAKAFERHSVADLLDWKPTRSPELEVQLEQDDVAQMIEAQNAYRRRRGAREITEADVHRQAAEDQAVRSRGRGAFSQADDELGRDAEGLDPKLVEAAMAPPKPRSRAKGAKGGPKAGKKPPAKKRRPRG